MRRTGLWAPFSRKAFSPRKLDPESPCAVPGGPRAGDEWWRMQSALEMRRRSGAAWFYWTAVFAIAASFLRSSGQLWAGALGLGILQSPVSVRLDSGERIAALAAAVAALALFGWFAGLGKRWAFAIGMLAYAADGALLALSA